MAITSKTVSLKNIIAKVYRDLGLKEEEDFVNFLEWGCEALEQIGVFEQLQTIDLNIPINFYKAELPCDLVYLNYVKYNNQNILPATNLQGSLKNDITQSTGLFLNDDKISTVVKNITNNKLITDYSISNGYLKVSIEKGSVDINYQAMPIDDEGYPTVPDDVSFREAVYRYIVYKWIYPQFIRGLVQVQIYKDAEEKWLWYCGQAGAKAQMPSLGRMESIARSYISLKPNLNQFKDFFENLNK